jgi:hypothetical protein
MQNLIKIAEFADLTRRVEVLEQKQKEREEFEEYNRQEEPR